MKTKEKELVTHRYTEERSAPEVIDSMIREGWWLVSVYPQGHASLMLWFTKSRPGEHR